MLIVFIPSCFAVLMIRQLPCSVSLGPNEGLLGQITYAISPRFAIRRVLICSISSKNLSTPPTAGHKQLGRRPWTCEIYSFPYHKLARLRGHYNAKRRQHEGPLRY